MQHLRDGGVHLAGEPVAQILGEPGDAAEQDGNGALVGDRAQKGLAQRTDARALHVLAVHEPGVGEALEEDIQFGPFARRGRGPPQARDGRPLQAGRRLQPFQIPAQPEEVRYDPCGQVALGAANGQRRKEHLRRADDFGPVLREHPHIFGGRATRQTAGQRVFIGQRPGEPAAHHLPPHAIEYEEEAKDDPARLEPLLTYTGRHRRRKQGAGRELPGELVDAGGEFLLPAVGEPRGRDRRHAAVERRTDQPFAEITRDDAARPLVAEP